MAEYSNLKKADLVSVLKKLGVHTVSKDTKKVLVDKVEKYIDETPNGSSIVSGLVEAQIDEEDENEAIDETTLNEEADDDEDDDAAEVIPTATESEAADEDDKDYEAPPPLSLKEWIADPLIEQWENVLSKVYEFTDSVGITVLEYSDDLREKLSKSITLNYLEVLVEFFIFIYTTVPLVALKDNGANLQLFKDNIPFLAESTILLPDFTALLAHSALSIFFVWFILAVLFPLTVSYFVNFTRRVLIFDNNEGAVARIYSYDPFTFALSKLACSLLPRLAQLGSIPYLV